MQRTGSFINIWGAEAVAQPEAGPLTDLWASRERFEPDNYADIPPAARLYLEHAIAPGTVLASSARLQMRGEIKLKKWHKFTAEQVIQNSHEFIWKARTYLKGMRIDGVDRLVDGKAKLQWNLFGLFPVSRASGPMTTRSATARAIAESIWIPSSLCARNVVWTALTERRPQAHLAAHGEWAELSMKIGTGGELKSVNVLRLRRSGDTFHYEPFGAIVEEEYTFGGYTIPTRLRVGYHAGTDRFEENEFLRVEIVNASFA